MEIFKDKLPSVDHRYCVKHLYNNVCAKFKGMELRDIIWKAAYASTPREFNNCMENIEKLDEKAYQYLNDLDPKCWSRSHFNSKLKCDVLVNNINESWNSIILEAREMPILQMLEWIRRKVMSRIQRKKAGMEKYKGSITLMAVDILKDNMHESRNCFAHYAGDMKFEVDYYDSIKVVDLVYHSYSCRNWDLTGIPCKHAIATIQVVGHDPEAYMHAWFSKDLYLKMYAFALSPILDQGEWEVTNQTPILPPTYKKPIGRPKQQRKR